MSTVYKDSDAIFSALMAGANGYLLKQTAPRELLAALREACAGGSPMKMCIRDSCWAEGKLREWNSHNGSIAQAVRALAEDKGGDIWMGSDDGNIYRFNGSAPEAVRLPGVSGQQAVWSLLADDDGSLWIGTSDAGLLHFSDGRFTRFMAKDGLPDDLICQIQDDTLGNLWLGTDVYKRQVMPAPGHRLIHV